MERDQIFGAPECGDSAEYSARTDASPETSSDAKESNDIGLQKRVSTATPAIRRVIVIGFVGGFVTRDDDKHPEVHFAQYLQDRYRSDVQAAVFGNHHGKEALHELLRLLDADSDGNVSSIEKDQTRIIIYGHSWGATETVVFARELEKLGIPVALTIQIDAIAKPGRNNSTIPPNVTHAINFYQARGPLHGQAEIVAADPTRTTILGNLLMTYENNHINCDNYPWYARTFNKPHHEIENDPRVWTQAAQLIDAEIPGTNPADRASLSWRPEFK